MLQMHMRHGLVATPVLINRNFRKMLGIIFALWLQMLFYMANLQNSYPQRGVLKQVPSMNSNPTQIIQ